jgi:capsular exopolysaccharide synthesis family protein
VTSALAGEGKTSLATNLAVGLARAGYRVAIVDADLRRPQVAEFLNIKPEFGLTDVLVGDVPLMGALTTADNDRLDVLAAGPRRPDPSELLGSDLFDQVIKGLAETHEYVIVDTAPVLPVTDALVVAPRVDGVLLVTQLVRTRRDEVRHALTALEGGQGLLLGVVANQAGRANGREYRYTYGEDAKDAVEPIDGAHAVGVRPIQPALPLQQGRRPRPVAMPRPQSIMAAPVLASQQPAVAVRPDPVLDTGPIAVIDIEDEPVVADAAEAARGRHSREESDEAEYDPLESPFFREVMARHQQRRAMKQSDDSTDNGSDSGTESDTESEPH